MKEITEISRRCEIIHSEGVDCGPSKITSVLAEMVFEDDGKKLYATMSWVKQMPRVISLEITDKEIWRFLVQDQLSDDDQLKLSGIRKASIEAYSSFSGPYLGDYLLIYEELKKNLKGMIIDHKLYEPKKEWEF